MRMWMTNPRWMCNQHLLGEHVELHMFVGTLNKDRCVQGYLDKGLLEIHNLHKRHDELVAEMERRGMRHKSPLPVLLNPCTTGCIDTEQNQRELLRRCKRCEEKITEAT
jgi:hypothetical protein